MFEKMIIDRAVAGALTSDCRLPPYNVETLASADAAVSVAILLTAVLAWC